MKNNWRNKIKRTKAQQNLNKICTCNLTDICINGLVMYFTKAAAIKQLSVRNLGLQTTISAHNSSSPETTVYDSLLSIRQSHKHDGHTDEMSSLQLAEYVDV